jgi:hypothetical protein
MPSRRKRKNPLVEITRARVLHDQVVRFRLADGRHIDRDFSLVEGGVFAGT